MLQSDADKILVAIVATLSASSAACESGFPLRIA